MFKSNYYTVVIHYLFLINPSFCSVGFPLCLFSLIRLLKMASDPERAYKACVVSSLLKGINQENIIPEDISGAENHITRRTAFPQCSMMEAASCFSLAKTVEFLKIMNHS